MTFSEISDARIAFEVHVCEDGSGMPAELQTVMQSLKLLERVMSPLKMETKIQKYQLYIQKLQCNFKCMNISAWWLCVRNVKQ